jgi:hypothetical protein
MGELTLGQRIKKLYKAQFRGRFPLADVNRLGTRDFQNLDLLHACLDSYLFYIAGYADGADRLRRRPRAELAEARRNLSLSFFDKQQALAVYRDWVTKEFTPDLFRELAIADELRTELLVEIDQILSEPDTGRVERL